MTPPPPPPSPCYESFGGHPRDEELSDGYGSSVETPSVDGENSIGAEVPEDEDYVGTRVGIHVTVVTQGFERHEVILGAETPSSDRQLWPPPLIFQRAAGELIDAEYTLVRVTLEGHETADLDEIAQDLDETAGSVLQVPSIAPLNDGSWEILVHHAYLPTLQRVLHERPIRLTLDSKYCPLEPLLKDVKYYGLKGARELYALWFLERALRMIRTSWAIAQMYYRHALERHHESIGTLLSGMGTMSIMEDSILDCLPTGGRDEDILRILMLIRHRLSKFQTGRSLRDSFQLGDVQAESLATSEARTSIASD